MTKSAAEWPSLTAKWHSMAISWKTRWSSGINLLERITELEKMIWRKMRKTRHGYVGCYQRNFAELSFKVWIYLERIIWSQTKSFELDCYPQNHEKNSLQVGNKTKIIDDLNVSRSSYFVELNGQCNISDRIRRFERSQPYGLMSENLMNTPLENRKTSFCHLQIFQIHHLDIFGTFLVILSSPSSSGLHLSTTPLGFVSKW